jgi:hypothetical protein
VLPAKALSAVLRHIYFINSQFSFSGNVIRDSRRITAAEVKYMGEKQQDTFGQIIKQTQRLQKS